MIFRLSISKTIIVYDFSFTSSTWISGKDTCQGDSGGPLMVRAAEDSPMYLRGALSFGSNKCGVKYPAVFTNIEAYIPWIKKHMYKEVYKIDPL